MEDRSELFNQLKGFSQRKLKKVETKVVTASGENLVEKRGAKGLQVLTGDGQSKGDQSGEPVRKLDLQVGFILPGLLIASQDVAHDKSSLESYGITHILNLDSNIENKFEDDYNYKNINMEDNADFSLSKVMDDCFDFIDDGRHYGNVLVHCSGTIGLSRSTTICIAYLMDKEKQKFDEALNNVKEARSFVKPNEGFVKQLKEYEVKLRGAQQVKDSGIDDPFALRKKQEIEQEKAMVAGAASVKNRMKMFGATLDTNASQAPSNRSKSVSPSPYKQSPQSPVPSSPVPNKPAVSSVASKWGNSNSSTSDQASSTNKSISKSMTPEPRKSWQDTRSSAVPPPPPPPPAGFMDGKSSPSSNRSSIPPPPQQPASSNETPSRNMFGRVPPPQMKIKGGLSIERQESKSSGSPMKSTLQLPLKKQLTHDSGGEPDTLAVERASSRSPSPSAALRAAKQEVAAKTSGEDQGSSHRGQLNRSSTKKILNLIKTKTKTDLTLNDGDENDEIDALLGALASESIDNIDWDELGLDEDEVKGIIEQGANDSDDDSSSSSSESDSEEDEEEEEEDEEEEVEEEEEPLETRTRRYLV